MSTSPPQEKNRRRFLPPWIGWLLLATVSLGEAAGFLFTAPSSFPAARATSAFTQADSDRGAILCEETSSVSQELSLLCQQESRRNRMLSAVVGPFPRVQKREGLGSSAQAPETPLLFLLFLPRKLSPPSGGDAPFLS